MTDELLGKRMENSPLDRALTHPKVPWVLLQEHGISKVAKEIARNLIGEGGPVTLAVSGATLTIASERITCLTDTRFQANDCKLRRIERRAIEEVKFLARLKRNRVFFIRDTELGNDAQHSLRLVFLRLRRLLRRLRRRGSTLLSMCQLNGTNGNHNDVQNS